MAAFLIFASAAEPKALVKPEDEVAVKTMMATGLLAAIAAVVLAVKGSTTWSLVLGLLTSLISSGLVVRDMGEFAKRPYTYIVVTALYWTHVIALVPPVLLGMGAMALAGMKRAATTAGLIALPLLSYAVAVYIRSRLYTRTTKRA